MIPPRLTRIVATVGPASSDPAMLRAMIEAGTDVVRLNASHGGAAFFRDITALVRKISEELDRPTAILMDLGGPKIRVGELRGGSVELRVGTELSVEHGDFEGTAERIPCTYAAIADDVEPGDLILLDDGLLELKVRARRGGGLRCEVLEGGTLRAHKGINVPGRAMSAPAFGAKDLRDLECAIELDLDYIALSFVRSAADIVALRKAMHARNGEIPIIAKIEKPQALDCIEDILAETDAIMVARGDLGVEIALERVPAVQKQLIRQANLFGVPVITATQMLESMMENPRPTRAETSDVANAIFDGTDAIMLSGETAAGKHPLEAIHMMDRIARQAESGRRPVDRSLERSRFRPGLRAMSQAAKRIADDVDARTIVVYTASGTTALALSKLRARRQIVALTPDPAVRRRMSLYQGVFALQIDFHGDTDSVLRKGDELLLGLGLAEPGERVVVMGGSRQFAGATDMVQLRRLGKDA